MPSFNSDSSNSEKSFEEIPLTPLGTNSGEDTDTDRQSVVNEENVRSAFPNIAKSGTERKKYDWIELTTMKILSPNNNEDIPTEEMEQLSMVENHFSNDDQNSSGGTEPSRHNVSNTLESINDNESTSHSINGAMGNTPLAGMVEGGASLTAGLGNVSLESIFAAAELENNKKVNFELKLNRRNNTKREFKSKSKHSDAAPCPGMQTLSLDNTPGQGDANSSMSSAANSGRSSVSWDDTDVSSNRVDERQTTFSFDTSDDERMTLPNKNYLFSPAPSTTLKRNPVFIGAQENVSPLTESIVCQRNRVKSNVNENDMNQNGESVNSDTENTNQENKNVNENTENTSVSIEQNSDGNNDHTRDDNSNGASDNSTGFTFAIATVRFRHKNAQNKNRSRKVLKLCKDHIKNEQKPDESCAKRFKRSTCSVDNDDQNTNIDSNDNMEYTHAMAAIDTQPNRFKHNSNQNGEDESTNDLKTSMEYTHAMAAIDNHPNRIKRNLNKPDKHEPKAFSRKDLNSNMDK
ncbi:DgyrCDS9378 [Dimorphilus gyrociliatus]|uniref:DgyrCDS9378 n=1 Tax=Dimorphilus gyrociliatus TaxID=2664684 RepID=A0A7I8VX60_9ANNE|nr:DgyrCDS9378 [Dimorphilus gyrociliatus]